MSARPRIRHARIYVSSPYPILTALVRVAKLSPAAFDMCFGLEFACPSSPNSVDTSGKRSDTDRTKSERQSLLLRCSHPATSDWSYRACALHMT
eukprot:3935682-Rhodomonas_salina.1